MTTVYQVNYRMHNTSGRNGDNKAHWGHCQMGWFVSRQQAETALANLANHPDFRGGGIASDEWANETTRNEEDEEDEDGKPSYDELLDGLHAALVCIADNPTFWAEEKQIRKLLQRDENVSCTTP
jgi:hypothetical protein